MKTKEELTALKAEYESPNRKLGELTDDEMEQVTGGMKIVVIKATNPVEGEKDQPCGIFIPGYPGLP